MQVVNERCCGLDVHKKSIVACLITPKGKEIRTFGTMTQDILDLADWLKQHECTHAAMESTGVYWKPIYNVFELEGIETLVVNAKHIKHVPGRKTDVKDAEWIADLLQHGLLRGSYIPNRPQRELRELVRYRRSLIDERARAINRMQKILEGANIKLSSVISDINGVSGRKMIQSLIEGDMDPKTIAQLAKGRMRRKIPELEQSLKGLFGHHQRMMLKLEMEHVRMLDGHIAELDREVRERMRPFEDELKLLDTIPGIGRRHAEHLIADIGTDMDRFPSDSHLTSWAGVAPGNNESAGKRKSGRTTQGNKKLKACLIEAAHAAGRSRGTYLSAVYHRLAARRGKKRAAVAVGRKILISAYHILKKKEPYRELGADYWDKRREQSTVNRAIRKLESLGYEVSIEKVGA